MTKFDRERMTFVLDSNDEFYEMVYLNKDKPVRVYVFERIDSNHLSKNPIGYADLEYVDWNQLDSYSYIGDESEELLNKYLDFNEKLINKLEVGGKFNFYV
jgi:alpha-amylase/alpha-mannosidase (GH57 family)